MIRLPVKRLQHWTCTLIMMSLACCCVGIKSMATPGEVSKQYSFSDRNDIRALIAEARSLALLGYHDSSMQIYRRVLERSILIHYKYGIARSLTNLGNAEAHLNQTSRAMDYFNAALNYCDTTDETRGLIAPIYNNKANIYFLWGDNEQAVRMLMNAMYFRSRFPSEISLSSIYINLSNILNLMGRYGQALVYLDKAETEAIHSEDPVALANTYHGKGSAYISLQEWEMAKDYMQKAIRIGRANRYDDIVYSAIVNMASIALGEHRPHEAIRYINEANALDADASPYYRIGALNALGKAYMELDRFGNAEEHVKKALALSRSFNSTRNLIETHQLMHQLYLKKRDYHNAYLHLYEEKKISDSLNNEKNATALMQVESRYRSARKDQEMANAMLLVNRQQSGIKIRNIWIGISVSGLLISTVIIFLLRRNYKHKQALEQERVQHLIRQQALNEMRAVIDTEEKERSRIARDLHDGIMIQFSTVKMNLSSLLGSNEEILHKESLRPYIIQLDKATQSLRKAAHHLMPDMLLEEGLAEAVYYFLNNLKKEVPFTITYEQLDKIPRFGVQFELAVYRIIQELIQNIIKHARATEAFVQLSYSNHQLGIDVEDNGVGLPPGNSEKMQKGTGLKSIESRMTALNGSIRIQSNGRGTSVSLEFTTDAPVPAG